MKYNHFFQKPTIIPLIEFYNYEKWENENFTGSAMVSFQALNKWIINKNIHINKLIIIKHNLFPESKNAIIITNHCISNILLWKVFTLLDE